MDGGSDAWFDRELAGCSFADARLNKLEATGQDVRIADPVVGQKSIGRVGIGPVLADQRNALAHGAPDTVATDGLVLVLQTRPSSPIKERTGTRSG
jgi:hypothetical protein